MSKELKPYERENIIIRKLRGCKNSKQYLITQLNATERGLERCKRTYEHDIKIYAEEIQKEKDFLDILDGKILDYSTQLKEFLPKPKVKPKQEKPIFNGKIECETCGRLFAKSGIKGHRKACIKKLELQKLQDEIEKLEIEETLEELDKEEKTEIIEEVEESIDLDELTEDVSFIPIDEPKEEGD